jgi:PadR family transcriptional regulator AphA
MNLRHMLLALLSVKPDSGYGLARLMRAELVGSWIPRLQQVYGELATLRDLGFVRVEASPLNGRPAKKVYHVTEPGSAALDAWWNSQSVHICRDDLPFRLYCLSERNKSAVVRQVQARLDKNKTIVAAVTRQLARKVELADEDLGPLLFLDVIRRRAEAEVAWCARVLSLIPRDDDNAAKSLRDTTPARGADARC